MSKPNQSIDQSIKWVLIDANNQRIGKIATKVAFMLTGKDNPQYSVNLAGKTKVVIINCDQLDISEKKADELRYHHTGYLGNLKVKTAGSFAKNDLLRAAIFGMMPKNKLRRRNIKNLYCYLQTQHPHKLNIT